MRAAGANHSRHSHLWKLAVTHSRARASFPGPSFPACACGYAGDRACACTEGRLETLLHLQNIIVNDGYIDTETLSTDRKRCPFNEAAIGNIFLNRMSSFCIPSTEKMGILKGILIEQFTVGSLTLIQSGTSPAPSLILSTEVSNDRTATVPRETQNHTWQLTRSCVYQLNILTNTCIIVISITLERN